MNFEGWGFESAIGIYRYLFGRFDMGIEECREIWTEIVVGSMRFDLQEVDLAGLQEAVGTTFRLSELIREFPLEMFIKHVRVI